jgi:UDP-N-acetyl-2-amino-2-deoxyglucuronate dehydrogenase
MQKVRFGIVGCGGIAEIHAKAMMSLETVSLCACFDLDAQKSSSFSSRWGCVAFRHLDQMLESAQIDAVVVATPSGAHLEPSQAAANHGIHVLVEKPLEISVDRCDAMIKCCQRNGVLLGNVFPSRFRDSYVSLKSSIADGSMGEIALVNANVPWFRNFDYYSTALWRGTAGLDGGGCLMNQGIHYVDLLNWLFGLPRTVMLNTSRVLHKIDCEDTAALLIRFGGNTIGTLNMSTCVSPGFPRFLDVWGSSQSAICTDHTLAARTCNVATASSTDPNFRSTHADPFAMDHRFHARVISDFYQAIQDQRPPAITGQDGKNAVAVVQSAYQSATEGRPVSVSLFSEFQNDNQDN